MPSMQYNNLGPPFGPISVNAQSASYSTVSADFVGGVFITMDNASANNLTVSPDMEARRPVTILQEGAGQTTIVAGSGVTLKSAGSRLALTERYSSCSIIPDPSDPDTYWVVGALS